MAKVISIGTPVNDSERKTIAHLRDNLSDGYTILHNFELLVGNQAFEIDLAVIAPHAVYLVDVKSTRGTISVYAGKWFPEGRPPFASPLGKLRQHARVTKSMLVGSPERADMKQVYVDAIAILTAEDAFVNDPSGVDSSAVVLLKRSVSFLQDTSRLPLQGRPVPNLLSLQGRIIKTLQGGARVPASRDLYGDWKIEERLGGTAFYTEYRAYNRFAGSSSGRVSLRLYEADPYLAQEEQEQQRKRIATAFSALNAVPTHPAIPGAKGFFQDETSGKYVLVVQEAPGKALRLHLRNSSLALTFDQKIRIVKDLLSGLIHLHEFGVVHRAINPSTVIIGPDGQTRLVDFDFARVGTNRSVTVGTDIYEKSEDNAYLAPEILSEPHKAGPAADLYAAGTVFYQLFTGEKPFESLDDALKTDCRFVEPVSAKAGNLPEGFDQWLQGLCNMKPEDRPEAVNALAQFEALFEQSTAPIPAKEEPRAPIDYTNLSSGFQLTSTYVVEKRLGKPGSFGVAYKVIDTLGDVPRVVKIIIKDRTSPVERLKQEYKHLLQIPPHPNVVKVIHADYLPADGSPFIVFEYIEGIDVSEMIENRTLSLHDAMKLAIQVAEGLHHLHEHGVTHCDIKPTNLLWTEQGAKIIDFNVSMSASNPEARGGGSRKYIPPDNDFDSEESDEDRRDRDVFALGVTLFQAVTGRYPWEDTGGPVPGKAPPDPRTMPSCSDLSSQMVEIITKAIAPKRSDRYRSAEDYLNALRGVHQYRQVVKSTNGTKSSASWQELWGSAEVPPNTNPFVSYLATLYSQSKRTNTGTRGLDKLGGQLYVETALDKRLVPEVLDGKFRLVVITGNAGDGKTAFLQKLEKEARKRGEQVTPAPGGNGAIFKHRGRRFLSNYDGSQDEGDKVNDTVLLEFLGPFQTGNDSAWPDNETRLIAINEGRLVDFIENHSSKFPLFKEIVVRGLKSSKPEHGVVVVNLNLRSIIAANGGTEEPIFDTLLDRYTNPRFWGSCSKCDLQSRCYAYHNVQTFRDATGGAQVQSRLRTLYTLTTLRGKLHITLRDLSSALAFTLTSAHDCAEIHDLYASGKKPEILSGFYFNSWLGGIVGKQSDRLLALLRQIDVGNVSDARTDRFLDFREPIELPGLMQFESRNSKFDREILQSVYGALPDDPGSGLVEERIQSHQSYVRSMRRLHYFECRDDSWKSLLPYKSSERMMRLIAGEESLSIAVKSVIRALNRGERLFDPHRLKGKLALQVRHVENGTIRCYRVFPDSKFTLNLKNEGAESPYIESSPSSLVLSFDGGKEESMVHTELVIGLDLFEMLERLNFGYKPTIEEVQGFLLSLNVFKNILSSAPYQEILLTSSGHTFYSIERQQNGKLVMALAESGTEYVAPKKG